MIYTAATADAASTRTGWRAWLRVPTVALAVVTALSSCGGVNTNQRSTSSTQPIKQPAFGAPPLPLEPSAQNSYPMTNEGYQYLTCTGDKPRLAHDIGADTTTLAAKPDADASRVLIILNRTYAGQVLCIGPRRAVERWFPRYDFRAVAGPNECVAVATAYYRPDRSGVLPSYPSLRTTNTTIAFPGAPTYRLPPHSSPDDLVLDDDKVITAVTRVPAWGGSLHIDFSATAADGDSLPMPVLVQTTSAAVNALNDGTVIVESQYVPGRIVIKGCQVDVQRQPLTDPNPPTKALPEKPIPAAYNTARKPVEFAPVALKPLAPSTTSNRQSGCWC